MILGGEGRLAFHGVDRIYPSTSALLKNGGRINLTLRRVTKEGSGFTACSGAALRTAIESLFDAAYGGRIVVAEIDAHIVILFSDRAW